ncbi:hypothetical protein QE152_g13452 [Popillia japonica]|uniref:Uncharacterized protein n=1 Tax=Popillia japonica TaxID=7064 RepID=A0AAW1LD76_POPJA
MANKTTSRFLKTNEDCLKGLFVLPKKESTGRPSKHFAESSERSKRRKTEELRSNSDADVLAYATQMKWRGEGRRDAPVVMKDLSTSPGRATTYKKAYAKDKETEKGRLSPLRSLAMLVEADLIRKQYEVIRSTKISFFPCYSVLQRAKTDAYPDKSSYTVTETSPRLNFKV